MTEQLLKSELDSVPESRPRLEVQEGPNAPSKAIISQVDLPHGILKPSADLDQTEDDTEYCPDCHVLLLEKDGDRFCPSCAVVWGPQYAEDDCIPFSEDSNFGHSEGEWNPGCLLAYGFGMGSNVGPKELYRILPKSPLGRKDLALRVCQLRLFASSTSVDDAATRNLLTYGSGLSKVYGFGGRDDLSVRFGDELGRLLRRVGRYLNVRGETRGQVKWYATCVFCLLLSWSFPERAEGAMQELHVSSAALEYFSFLMTFLRTRT